LKNQAISIVIDNSENRKLAVGTKGVTAEASEQVSAKTAAEEKAAAENAAAQKAAQEKALAEKAAAQKAAEEKATETARAYWTNRVIKYFVARNPRQAHPEQVEDILNAFEKSPGGWEKMWESLVSKHGPEPDGTEALMMTTVSRIVAATKQQLSKLGHAKATKVKVEANMKAERLAAEKEKAERLAAEIKIENSRQLWVVEQDEDRTRCKLSEDESSSLKRLEWDEREELLEAYNKEIDAKVKKTLSVLRQRKKRLSVLRQRKKKPSEKA